MKPILFRTLIIVVGILIVAGCATHPQQWEYRTRTTDNPKGKSVLDGYGNGGWELVDYSCRPKDETGTNFVYQYVFKRPKK
jgi:hypothetical protein